jgi:exodeoxyribonuclease-3
MKLATWNINSLGVRLPQLLDWLAANPVDVIALQELKLTDDKFPKAELEAAGYRGHWFGQKTYNGVALLHRDGIGEAADVTRNIAGFEDDQARVIAGTYQRGTHAPLRVVGVYVPNGQSVGSDKYAYKLKWLDALREWLRAEIERHPRLALMGDFNIAPDDRDVHDPAAWAGQVLCSEPERDHFRALIGLGMHDSFRLFEQPPKLYSWWDYRMLAFRRNQGLRIDHILVTDPLKNDVIACAIDKLPRKNERPSDHAPVVAELKD